MISRTIALVTVAVTIGFAQPASAQLFKTLFGGDDARVEEVKPGQKKANAVDRKVDSRKVEKKTAVVATRTSEQAATPVAIAGNDGELRSVNEPRRGIFGNILSNQPDSAMLPQTRALDTLLAEKDKRKKFVVKPELEPTVVAFSGYKPGTIVVDTSARALYLVEGRNQARRYRIAVGKEGLAFKGTGTVGDKQEWPRWFPTKDMQQREPKKYGQYAEGMNGGPDNPLGARAIYLYQGKKDTHIRIHGTNQPQTIGTASSNGCFRMINEHVMDLYRRVQMGAEIVVL
jgi:lipoprotein-anchoring transpeptidase ErfK/SrfK